VNEQLSFLGGSGAATLPCQPHSATSRAAARAAAPCADTQRERVYSLIAYSGAYGMTDQEIQAGLRMEGSTQRPRRIELHRAGRIAPADFTRPTPSGRAATVWVATRGGSK